MSVITLTIRYPAGDRFVPCAHHVSLRSKLHHCLRWSWIRHRTLWITAVYVLSRSKEIPQM